jgi:hypothetical protein
MTKDNNYLCTDGNGHLIPKLEDLFYQTSWVPLSQATKASLTYEEVEESEES